LFQNTVDKQTEKMMELPSKAVDIQSEGFSQDTNQSRSQNVVDVQHQKTVLLECMLALCIIIHVLPTLVGQTCMFLPLCFLISTLTSSRRPSQKGSKL